MPDAHKRPLPLAPDSLPHKKSSSPHHSELCFISLILGIFGLILPLFSALAIIFGIGGLMQVGREKLAGRWMSLLGIMLGFLGILLVLIAILFHISLLQDYFLRFGTIDTLVGNAYKN